MLQVNPLRGFPWKIKPYFLRKIKSKKLKCRLLQFLLGALRVNTLHCFVKHTTKKNNRYSSVQQWCTKMQLQRKSFTINILLSKPRRMEEKITIHISQWKWQKVIPIFFSMLLADIIKSLRSVHRYCPLSCFFQMMFPKNFCNFKWKKKRKNILMWLFPQIWIKSWFFN